MPMECGVIRLRIRHKCMKYLLDFAWVHDSIGQGAFELVFDPPVVIKPPNIPEGETLVSIAPYLAGSVRGAGWIKYTGRRPLRLYRPDKIPNLHLRFMEIRSSEDLLQFVNKFGPLTNTGKDPMGRERV